MTINVSSPGGVNIAFPDGTDADTISKVMAQAHGGAAPDAAAPAPEAPPSQGILHSIKDAFTGEDRTEFPDAQEFRVAAAPGRRAEYAAGKSKWNADDIAVDLSTLTSDPKAQLDILKAHIPDVEDKTDKFGNIMVRAPSKGVNDWTYLNKPGLSKEDFNELATQGVASLPFMPLMGAAGSIPARIGLGALGAGASSVANDLGAVAAGSKQGVDPGQAAVSSIVGGIGGGLLGNEAARLAPAVGDDAIDAANAIGMKGVPGFMTNDTAGKVAGALQRVPVVGNPISKAAEGVASDLGDAADRFAAQAGAGATYTPRLAGEEAGSALEDWITKGSQVPVSNEYDKLDKLVRQDAMVPLPNTLKAVQDMALKDAAAANPDNANVYKHVLEAVTRPQGLTYAGLKELRTRIGQRVFGEIVPEDGTSAKAFDKLYGSLSDDLTNAVKRAGIAKSGSSGRKALAQLKVANDLARDTFAARDALAPIIGKKADASGERVFESLVQKAGTGSSADFATLSLARDKIGEEKWGKVQSALIARMGRDANGNFSPARFMTSYGKLSDEGKRALFGGKSAAIKDALDNIRTVSQRFAEKAQKYVNTSNTAITGSTLGAIGGLITAPITTLGSIAGGWTLAKALSRPATAKAAERWIRAYAMHANAGTRGTMTVLQQATKQFEKAQEAPQ